MRSSFFQVQKSTLSIKPGSKMFAHHGRRAGDKTKICVESMVGVFDLFSLKIVSPLWRNDLVYVSPQVKLFRHWRCGEWLALPQNVYICILNLKVSPSFIFKNAKHFVSTLILFNISLCSSFLTEQC